LSYGDYYIIIIVIFFIDPRIQDFELNDFVFEQVVSRLENSGNEASNNNENSETITSALNYCDENQAAIITNFFDENVSKNVSRRIYRKIKIYNFSWVQK
jgi:alpha-D-ribose 1-methylphosphonate 5-triphosphate synthase subunit PhnL